MTSNLSDSIPNSFICPITHNIMNNPYIDNDGNTYEHSAIIQWLNCNNTSPITRNILYVSHLKPNRSLLELINNYKSSNSSPTITNNIINNNNNTDSKFVLDDKLFDININKYIKNEYTYFLLNINVNDTNIAPPIDIVTIIDISGSMDSSATVQQNGNNIDVGFTILDITKHALNTIIESMKSTDRISIITFSNYAETLCELTYINDNNKNYIQSLVNNLQTQGATNIWAGINKGLDVFLKKENHIDTRIKSLLLLTDGIPSNHLSPPRGILETLERKINILKDGNIIIPNIYTFGFGNNLDTDLLVNISKKGYGHFSYIPDSSFVGTIFIHYLAYINTLVCNQIYLDFEYMCSYFKNNVDIIAYNNDLNLNSLHIGHDRNIVFKILNNDLDKCNNILAFSLKYKTINNENRILQKNIDKNIDISNDFELLDYNIYRLDLISIFNNFPYEINNVINNFQNFINLSIIPQDISKDLQQINLALNKYYNSWGKNYINSFISALFEERCNNFKDFSIQKYGGILFKRLKDIFDDIFSNLSPPIPSNNTLNYDISSNNISVSSQQFSQTFNNPNAGCFHPDSPVIMSDYFVKKISDLKKYDQIIDKNGNISSVLCLIKIKCNNNLSDMVKLDGIKNDIFVTPYHPVLNTNFPSTIGKFSNDWIFPCTINNIIKCHTDYVYNLVLDKNHNLVIDNYVFVTLGHNNFTNFVVSHQYFGKDIINDLQNMYGYYEGLITLNQNNIIRCNNTNRIIKWKQ